MRIANRLPGPGCERSGSAPGFESCVNWDDSQSHRELLFMEWQGPSVRGASVISMESGMARSPVPGWGVSTLPAFRLVSPVEWTPSRV